MELRSLNDLFTLELKDLYNAEHQILDALPKMAEKASHPELKAALNEHVDVTREQVRRLEEISDTLGVNLRGHKCKGMEGLIHEAKDVMKEEADPNVLDAGLIGQAQRIEHYEIAAYGTARTFAERLGFTEAARLLQQTLDEEGETDHRLTGIAEQVVNPDAQMGGGAGTRAA